MTLQFLAWLEAHVVEALLETSLLFLRNLIECWDALGNADTHTWVSTISDTWFDILCLESQLFVEDCVITTLQGLPVSHSLVPLFTLRCIFTTLDVLECCLIRSYEATTGTHLDREIAESETTFHRHIFHYITTVLYEVTSGTRSSELTHEVEGNVLGSNPLTELTVDADTHRLWLALKNTL
ncbi:flp pilus assembly protein TadG [Prevotella sp. CAG:386]|nr:flp pilus assembly protein TadG [Prevotella sp. CAG:386]